MENKDQNIKWLSEYQGDMIKIVSKHRRPHHKLTVEEIISEVNNYFMSKLCETVFENETEFRKFTHMTCRNFIKWTANGAFAYGEKKYLERKDDSLVKSEEGNKTIFDYMCQTIGAEDPVFAKLNHSEKYNNIIKWLLDYSNILTPRQKNIFPFVLQGKTLDELGNALGVTHQAISHSIMDIYDRIKSYIKIDINEDCDKEILIKGNRAINYLFSGERNKTRKLKIN